MIDQPPIRWGLVATIKANATEILDFAAHHLEMGAHRLYLYLDAPCPKAWPHLKAHPKIRVTECDQRHWKRLNGRPAKHQVRQTKNASHAYAKAGDVDWLAHIDVDEFLWPETSIAASLAALPGDVQTGRMRPMELMVPDPANPLPGQLFKALPVPRDERRAATLKLYPHYAAHIDDGFLSHVAGKVFLRTGLEDVEFRIHNAFVDGQQNPGQVELPDIALLHMHARGWEDWSARFDYRHAKGAYRAELGRKGPSGLTLHQFFSALLEQEGQPGLRAFYDRICLATQDHCAALSELGLLRDVDLDLADSRRKQFPAFTSD